MNLSSDGTNWWAKRRGRIVIQGDADAAGLYWVKVTRLPQIQFTQKSQLEDSMAGSSRNVTMSSHALQLGKQDGVPRQNSPNPSAPLKDVRSPTLGNSVPDFAQPSRNEPSSDSHSESSGNEGDEDTSQTSGKPRPLSDVVCLTRQQTTDLLSAHLRWGHKSFRRCAFVLGVPSPDKPPCCGAALRPRHPDTREGHVV